MPVLQLLTKLHLYEPVEVLIPSSATELKLLLKNNFDECEIITVARKYYNESRGLSYIKQLSHTENKVSVIPPFPLRLTLPPLSDDRPRDLLQVPLLGMCGRATQIRGVHPDHHLRRK